MVVKLIMSFEYYRYTEQSMRRHGDVLAGVGKLCNTVLHRIDDLSIAIPNAMREAAIVGNLTQAKEKGLKVRNGLCVC